MGWVGLGAGTEEGRGARGGVAGGGCAQRATWSGTRFTGRWMVLGTAVTDRIVGTKCAIVYGSHRQGPMCTYVMNYLSPRPSFAIVHTTRKVFPSGHERCLFLRWTEENDRGALCPKARGAPLGRPAPESEGLDSTGSLARFCLFDCSFPFFLPPRLPHPNRERPTLPNFSP